jgi:hypothetical protein
MANPGPKIQIELSTSQAAFLERYDNLAGAQVKEDLDLFQGVMDWAEQEAAGKFSPTEAMLLCESLMEIVLNNRRSGRLDRVILLGLDKAMRDETLVRKYKVDRDKFWQKIGKLTMPEALAIWHWVKLFYTDPEWDKSKVGKLFRCG